MQENCKPKPLYRQVAETMQPTASSLEANTLGCKAAVGFELLGAAVLQPLVTKYVASRPRTASPVGCKIEGRLCL